MNSKPNIKIGYLNISDHLILGVTERKILRRDEGEIRNEAGFGEYPANNTTVDKGVFEKTTYCLTKKNFHSITWRQCTFASVFSGHEPSQAKA